MFCLNSSCAAGRFGIALSITDSSNCPLNGAAKFTARPCGKDFSAIAVIIVIKISPKIFLCFVFFGSVDWGCDFISLGESCVLHSFRCLLCQLISYFSLFLLLFSFSLLFFKGFLLIRFPFDDLCFVEHVFFRERQLFIRLVILRIRVVSRDLHDQILCCW